MRLKAVISPRVQRARKELEEAKSRVRDLTEQLEQAKSEVMVAQKRLTEVTLKARKRSGVDLHSDLVYNLTSFERSPSRALAAKQLEIARQLDEWDALSLLGLYLELHEAKFERELKFSVLGLKQLYSDIRTLHSRVEDEAYDAIAVVFSKKLAWVENPMGLLLSENGYERFIVPALKNQRKERHGEQAEWTLGRTAEASCEEIEL